MTFYTNIDKVVAFSYPSYWFALFNTLQLVILLPLLFICVGFMYSHHIGDTLQHHTTCSSASHSSAHQCWFLVLPTTWRGLRSFPYESHKILYVNILFCHSFYISSLFIYLYRTFFLFSFVLLQTRN